MNCFTLWAKNTSPPIDVGHDEMICFEMIGEIIGASSIVRP